MIVVELNIVRLSVYDDTALQTAAYPSLEPLPLTTYLSATVIVLMMSSWAERWLWREGERIGQMEGERWECIRREGARASHSLWAGKIILHCT